MQDPLLHGNQSTLPVTRPAPPLAHEAPLQPGGMADEAVEERMYQSDDSEFFAREANADHSAGLFD